MSQSTESNPFAEVSFRSPSTPTARRTGRSPHAAADGGAAGSEAERSEALGKDTEVTKQQGAGRGLWRLQATMWDITESTRLKGCHRWLAPNSGGVTVDWSEKQSRFGGVQSSNSVWASPVASSRILNLREAEVSAGLSQWVGRSADHNVVFVTLTLRHKQGQPLGELWGALSYCWTGVTNSAAWRGGVRTTGDVVSFGIRHWTKSVEVTHGENGWHPHLHVALLVDKPLTSENIECLRTRMLDRWRRAAKRAGLQAPSSARGVRVDAVGSADDVADVAGYLTKGQLAGLSKELTQGTTKRGRNGNRTPFQVLADIAAAEGQPSERDLAIWREWESASDGRRQIAWSRGAKEDLGILDLEDQDLLAADDEEFKDEAWSVVRIDPDVWGLVGSWVDFRCDLIEHVRGARTAEAAQAAASELLSNRGIPHELIMTPKQRAPKESDEERAERRKAERMRSRRQARSVLDAGQLALIAVQ